MKDYPLDNIFCMIREAVEAARSEGFELGRAVGERAAGEPGRFTWKTRGGDLVDIQRIVIGAERPFEGRCRSGLTYNWRSNGRIYEQGPEYKDDLMVPDWFKF